MKSKTLLITGGSRGIGAATAIIAAEAGWNVAVNYLSNAVAAEEVVQEIRSLGREAEAIQGDIGSRGDIKNLFTEVDRIFGQLDGFVNNAAAIPSRMSFLDNSVDEITHVIETNLIGPMSCLREAAKRMSNTLGGSGGSIVNISSEAGRFGGRGITAYAASKAGINVMTIGLARELSSEGIRVNAVSPGIIDTESNATTNVNEFNERLSSLPMGRMGSTREVGAAIVWLLSEEASYISGAILPVTGAR